MMTWTLWWALRHPHSTHPLFRRMLRSQPGGVRILDEAFILRFMSRLMSLVLIVAVFALAPIILTSILGAPILMLLIIQAFGIRYAVNVGSAIASEQERGTYELTSLFPQGALGANWMMGSGCLHKGSSFVWLQGAVRLVLGFLITVLVVGYVVAIIIMISEYMGSSLARTSVTAFITLSNYASLVAAFYFDYVQSVVLGSLVGMIVPIYVHNRFDARLWSLSSYMLLQLTVYLTTWLVGFVLLPEALERLTLAGWQVEISLPILRVAVFYFVREGIIAGLWHMLAQRLNAHSTEINLIFRQAVR
jgi:hypothetical protein